MELFRGDQMFKHLVCAAAAATVISLTNPAPAADSHTQVWGRQIGGSGSNYPYDVSADATGVYMAMSNGDANLLRYARAGNLLWSRPLGDDFFESALGVFSNPTGGAFLPGN